MKKPALRSTNPISYESENGSAPAPVGGWNTRDSIANMPPTDAVVLDNWFPSSTSVDLRNGSVTHATGFATRVKTLMEYASPTASEFYGCDNTGIYNISLSGPIGAAVTSLTEGYCQHINFSTAAGAFLMSVNGFDPIKLYNGTTWQDVTGVSVPVSITGITTSNVININAFKNRIWLIQKNSLDVWYLPVASVGGAATQFTLSGLFTRGGYLMSMGTWTIDGGAGVDDFAVFATSEGEIAVYQGTDPSSPSTWSLVGVYFIGEPIGRRCFTKYGGDLLFLCLQGLYPLSVALQTASIDRTNGLSDKISPTFNESALTFKNNQGWQTTIFPEGNMLLVNVPAYVGTAAYQYCMNLITQSWCRFTEWNAAVFFLWNSRLYYGTETSVVQAWVGSSDNNNYITGTALTAFSYLETPRIKHFKMVRPVIQADSSYDMYVGVTTDFDQDADYSLIPAAVSGGALWDVALWDVAMWGAGLSTSKNWIAISVNPGTSIAAKMQIRTKFSSIKWQSTDYIYQTGGFL